jgi:hypothetical protein
MVLLLAHRLPMTWPKLSHVGTGARRCRVRPSTTEAAHMEDHLLATSKWAARDSNPEPED